MTPGQRVGLAAIVTALTVGVGIAVREGAGGKPERVTKDKRGDVRAFKRDDGTVFYGYFEDEKRRDIIVETEPACVIPDCTDDVTPVDCLRTAPGESKPRWAGCNAMFVDESSGTQCKPWPCVGDLK